jgi:hypothetical protein
MADAVMPAAASTVLAGSTVPLVADSTVVVADSMAEEAVASTEEAVVMAGAADTGNPGSVNQLERLASEMLPAVSLCGASPFLARISVFTGIAVVKYQQPV